MTRKLAWTDAAWSDYLYWQRQDRKTLKRINKLIEATLRLPFEGIGKPEEMPTQAGRKDLADCAFTNIGTANVMLTAIAPPITECDRNLCRLY